MKHETTKQRLQELAGVRTPRTSQKINEAISMNGVVKLEVSISVKALIDMFGGVDMLDPSVLADPNKFKEFTRTVTEDLANWMFDTGGESRTWAADGVDAGTYDDFVAGGDY